MIYDSKYIYDQINVKRSEGLQITSEELLCEYASSGNEEPIKSSEIKDAYKQLRLMLAEHLRLDNVVFLFGNGVSIYAGSRNTNQTQLLKYLNDNNYSDIADIIKNICDKIPNSIEEQLNALNTVLGFYSLTSDARAELVQKLLTSIKAGLLTDYVNSINYKKLYLHENMLLKLRSFDCLHKTRLYTLNYDLAFEYTMDKLGIEYRDGFTGFVNRTFDARTLQNKTVTSLIKMHGSVNWVTEHDTIKEFQPKFIEDENSVLFSMEEAKQKSVLIYPSSNKLYQTYASPYSELMRNLLDQLQTGKNLVIVLGYKYGDEHINDILLKSLRNPNDVFYTSDNPVCLAQDKPSNQSNSDKKGKTLHIVFPISKNILLQITQGVQINKIYYIDNTPQWQIDNFNFIQAHFAKKYVISATNSFSTIKDRMETDPIIWDKNKLKIYAIFESQFYLFSKCLP